MVFAIVTQFGLVPIVLKELIYVQIKIVQEILFATKIMEIVIV